MRRAQIRHGLDAEQLRRGRERKSESGLRDWTLAEDVQLLKVVWSGARGEKRRIPTRGHIALRLRSQGQITRNAAPLATAASRTPLVLFRYLPPVHKGV